MSAAQSGSAPTGAASVAAAATPAASAAAVQWPAVWGGGVVMGLPSVGYSAEQWAVAQHNWQQWSQWNEQYRQWHMQYGDKYTEQMTTYQVGTQPPLPPAASESRPPPPPDGPPPQIAKPGDAHVQPKSQSFGQSNSYDAAAGPQYYYTAASIANSTVKPAVHYETSAAAQSGAKPTNADQSEPHVDYPHMKQPYTSAESAWYSQIQASANDYMVQNSYVSEEERQFDVHFKKWEAEFETWKQQNVNHPDRAAYQEYEKRFQACRAQLMERKKQMRAKRLASLMSQKQDSKNSKGYYQSEENNYESVRNADGTKGDVPGGFLSDDSNFLTKISASKGIPGLDLVEDHNKRAITDIVDITDSDVSSKPDLKAISKGINNILGDQKLLNMLSMVTQNTQPSSYANVDGKKSRWNDDYLDASSNQGYQQTYKAYQNMYDTSQGYGDVYDASQNSAVDVNYYQTGDSNTYQAGSEYYQQSMYQTQPAYDHDSQQEYYEQAGRGYTTAYGTEQMDTSSEAPAKQWADVPILEPHIIVDYQHESVKPIIEFLEPVQTFDYGHMSSSKGNSKESRDSSWMDSDSYQPRVGSKSFSDTDDSFYKNRNVEYPTLRFEERFDKYRKNDKNPARERDFEKREERSRSRYDDRNRFRDRSHERIENYDRSSSNDRTRRVSESKSESPNRNVEDIEENSQSNSEIKNIVMIDDILELPGRDVRPEKIVVILRGLPGSGKSYLAKLIKDREVENGGSARILSMDDYFMFESDVSVEDPETGRVTIKREMKYEYDASMEEVYNTSLIKSLRRTMTDGFFPFIIVDSVNNEIQHLIDLENIGKQFGFKVYVCEMDVDIQTCFKRNIHQRTLEDIQKLSDNWCVTPPRFTMLDITTILQTAAIDHVQMEDVSDGDMEEQSKDIPQNEEEEVLTPFSSKWDNMDDTDKLARLDGTSKPLRPKISTMEDFLQLNEWESARIVQPGKKTVRWADIEERRKQEKMRAIGFVVGQTDWERMNDPTQGSSALTQTKYIERISKY